MKIKIPSKSQQTKVENLVDSIMQLNERIMKVGQLSDEGKKLQEEVNTIDKQIDEKIYEIYSLPDEEIKIVESR